MKRQFLNWDRPFLPAAAAYIADLYAADGELRLEKATLVVPGARAGRRLRELLLDESERRELRLIPPSVLTTGRLPEQLYEPVLPAASAALCRRVWAVVLREMPAERLATVFSSPPAASDLPGWTRLARIVQGLHQEVSGAALRFDDVVDRCSTGMIYADTARWEVLAQAQAEYSRRMTQLGFGDPGLQRLEALEKGAVALEGELFLCGISEMPEIVRQMVMQAADAGGVVTALVHAPDAEAGAFDQLGQVQPTVWLKKQVPLTEDELRVRARPSDQADEVVGFLESLGGRYAADEIMVAVPDEELFPYLEQRLTAAAVPIHVGQGEPVERSRPVQLLKAIAGFAEGRSYQSGASLVRHPDMLDWLHGRTRSGRGSASAGASIDWISALDRHFSEHLPLRLPAPGKGQSMEAAGLVARLVNAFADKSLLGRLEGRRTLSEWAPEILALLLEIYGAKLDRGREEERRLTDALRILKNAAAELHALPAEADEACGAAAAIDFILDEAQGGMVASESDAAAVELLGWLELHLDDSPVAVITGFNEQFLPESTGAHAFLPNSLRTHLGLVDNDLRYARDAYQLTALLESREQVCLIAGRRTSKGDPLRPSRLMFAVEGDDLARRVKRFYGQEGEINGACRSRRTTPGEGGEHRSSFELPPEPTIRAPEPIQRLSVSQFRSVLADPYLFALERVLRLAPIDDSARELDGLAFGNLAHAALESFGRSPARDSTDQRQIAEHLDQALLQLVEERYGDYALPAVQLQMEQLRMRLNAFAGWQARWRAAGWSIVGVECRTPPEGVQFQVDGEPFTISGRIDRIDHHPDLGWALFDYKTGDRGESPEETHRKGKEKEWIDLQLPLYRHLLAEVRDLDGTAPLPIGDQGPIRLGYILLPRDPKRVGECFAEWNDDQLQGADEQARTVVRFLRSNVYHFDASSLSQQRAGPLAALLGIGYLESAEGEEVE
ncbi:PD-(D/E)XK nuclease family protein [soil metagenome]